MLAPDFLIIASPGQVGGMALLVLLLAMMMMGWEM